MATGISLLFPLNSRKLTPPISPAIIPVTILERIVTTSFRIVLILHHTVAANSESEKWFSISIIHQRFCHASEIYLIVRTDNLESKLSAFSYHLSVIPARIVFETIAVSLGFDSFIKCCHICRSILVISGLEKLLFVFENGNS